MLTQYFQSFDVKINLFCCILNNQGLLPKIQALLLQIQGVFKEKSFSRSFQGPSSFSRSIPGPCEPCKIRLTMFWLSGFELYSRLVPMHYET